MMDNTNTTNALTTTSSMDIDNDILPFPVSQTRQELEECEELVKQFGSNWTEQVSFMIVDDDDDKARFQCCQDEEEEDEELVSIDIARRTSTFSISVDPSMMTMVSDENPFNPCPGATTVTVDDHRRCSTSSVVSHDENDDIGCARAL